MSAKTIFKSELYTSSMEKIAVIEMDEDKAEIFRGMFRLPGTDITYKFTVYDPESMNEAESLATQTIYNQLSEWKEICEEMMMNLPKI
jgi:hypothetical protein